MTDDDRLKKIEVLLEKMLEDMIIEKSVDHLATRSALKKS